jgi:RNA polymerase sigma-70 factor (ECF subfamily)
MKQAAYGHLRAALDERTIGTTRAEGAIAAAFDAPAIAGPLAEPEADLEVRTIYREHGRFVWLSLQRLGIHPSDLDDIAQDVFMIVHRRLDTFDRRARVSTWLFGICMRVAANYRRRRRWTREVLSNGSEDDRPATLTAADDILVRREQRDLAERALNRLEVAKRATFVMFELESLSCLEIADLMNVPVGTVYSRLHSARRQLEKHLSRELARRGLGNG